MPLPPPPPLWMRVAVAKRLLPRSNRKRPADELPLASLKALKVSPGSSSHWVVEAQAAIQRGVASTRADSKEPTTQGGAAEVTPTQAGEGVLPPREGKAHESDRAGVPLVAEAPRASEAEATEAGAPKTAETAAAGVGVSTTIEATMVEAGAPEIVEAMTAEAGAPMITEADVMAARPSAQEAEMKAAEALVAPLDQLQRQKGLLTGANELLAARSVEVEDLWLCCADVRVEVVTAQGQVAPLTARVKELEEELTRVAGDRDAFRSRAEEATASGKAVAGQLGVEESAHQLTKGALDEALTVVEASPTEAVV
ncbi:uncharacterized protein [Miscanthus floridulus]|uniref:uncharacterized protein n=1 Tax=Miscanthus floridulus TaxID=154761 RepID=UPI0034598FFF